jgi:hypothetical protein
MKKLIYSLGIISLLIWGNTAHATFVSGSTGVLGSFNPTGNTVVTLPPDGVLNYTTITIPAGVTVTFTKNAANTPVYMLATGDVVIAGAVNVSGTSGSSTDAGKGGPGGFDGGYGGSSYSGGGKGLGPGGGGGAVSGNSGAGGGFGANGTSAGPTAGGQAYGNARLLPLIGGSGGGGGGTNGTNAGGGGGAIVIASSTTITLTGAIYANGQFTSANWWPGTGGGSGGGIKLVANTISGNGTLSAAGGNATNYGVSGGVGRIRVEAYSNSLSSGASNPPYTFGSPTNVFLTNPPTLKITTIGGYNVPASPTGAYNQPDITIPSNDPNPVIVNVSATNIPAGTSLSVLVIPQYGGATTSVKTSLNGTDQESTASASVTLSTAYVNVVTAQATFTVTAMYYDGEEIDKVRVATTLGGKSETTYITKSGKEIKGELVAALMK